MARRHSRFGPPSFKPTPPKPAVKRIQLDNGSSIRFVEPQPQGEVPRLSSGAPRPGFLAPPTKRNRRHEMAYHVRRVDRLREDFFGKPRHNRVLSKPVGTETWVTPGEGWHYAFLNPFEPVPHKQGTEDVVSLHCPGCNAYVASTFWMALTVNIPCTSPFACRGASRTQEHMLNFCLPCAMVTCGVLGRLPEHRVCSVSVSYDAFLAVIDTLTEPEGPYRDSKFEKFQQRFFDLLKTEPTRLSAWQKDVLAELEKTPHVRQMQVLHLDDDTIGPNFHINPVIMSGSRGQGKKSSYTMRYIAEAMKKMEQNGLKPSVVILGDLHDTL